MMDSVWIKCSSSYYIIVPYTYTNIASTSTSTLQAFLPDMLDQSCGHIVNLASVAGQAGTNKLVINI